MKPKTVATEPVNPAALTTNEQARLAECEAVIEKGLDTFVEVGIALDIIRGAKLYRFRYKTFEEYCNERWGFKKRRAYALIEASKVVKGLEGEYKNVHNCAQITNAGQAAALAKIPPDKRMEALKNVAALGGPVTAKAIEAQKKNFSPYTTKQPEPAHQTNLPIAVPVRSEWKTAVKDLVARRHKVWAEKFGQFPRTIEDEIIKTVEAALSQS